MISIILDITYVQSSNPTQIKNSTQIKTMLCCPWDCTSSTQETSRPMYGRVYCLLCEEWCTNARLLPCSCNLCGECYDGCVLASQQPIAEDYLMNPFVNLELPAYRQQWLQQQQRRQQLEQ